MNLQEIRTGIEKEFANPRISKDDVKSIVKIENLFNEFLGGLNSGTIRAAEPINNKWIVNKWVKQGILLLFRYGEINEKYKENNTIFSFFEKHTLKLKDINLSDNIRIVPGGSSIRNGAYVGSGVVCMPPMYINIGAYISDNTMIDSHALIGTCAQIGQNVHISAASQIGGVLEPIGANPVIIEDGVIVGGNCGVYEGVIVKKNAILGSGVILTSSVKIYDLVNETILINSEKQSLTIPENAVVVQGSRGITSEFGRHNNLSISTPIIVKYRDAKTDSKTELEMALR